MNMRSTLLTLIAAVMVGAAPMAFAKDDTALPALSTAPVTPLDLLHALKQPIVPTAVSIVRDEVIRIELTDSKSRKLIVDVGGERPPGTVLEIFRGTPRDGIVLKSSEASTEGIPLEKSGRDEKQILRILQEWREQTGTATPAKPAKPAAKGTLAVSGELQLQLVDRAIATLKERHQPQQPAARSTR